MLNRKELFHRNLIDEPLEVINQDQNANQNIELNSDHMPTNLNNSNINNTQGRDVTASENLYREFDNTLNGVSNHRNLVNGNRSQSSHPSHRVQHNKKDNNKTVKRVQGKWIK